MQTSESIKGISGAILALQAELDVLQEGSVNPHFKNTYLDLPDLVRGIKPALQKNGLAYVQGFSQSDPDRVVIDTLLMHTQSGEWIKSTLTMPVPQGKPQEAGSAITYGRRYALGAILGIATDKDDDAERATGREATTSNGHTNGTAQRGRVNDGGGLL